MPGIIRPPLPPRPPAPKYKQPTVKVQTGTRSNPNPLGPRRQPVTQTQPITATQGMPSYGGTPQPQPKPTVPPKKVVVHPDGTVEVHHNPPPKPVQAGAGAPAPTHPKPHPTSAPHPATGGATAAPQLSIQDQAQAELDPVKKAILDAINQRVNAQQGAITGYAKDLAQMMGSYAPAAKAIYQGAQGGQAAVDSSLGATLAGQGGSQNDALAAKLAAIDADPGTAARINGAAASDLSGAGGAFAAKGATSLSDLISRGASAQDYGAKLPGVAGLYGLQATKTAQSQATTDTANAVASLEGQVPTIVQNLRQNAATARQQRLEAKLAQKQYGIKIDEQNAKTNTVNATLSRAYGVQTNAQGQAIVGKNGTPIPYPTGGGAAPKVSVALSKAYGILVDNTGSPILHQGKPVEYPTANAGTGKLHGLSASKYQTEQAKAAGLARIAHEPTADGHPGVSWQTYLTGALKSGVPWWIVIKEGKKVYSQAEIRLGLIPGQGK